MEYRYEVKRLSSLKPKKHSIIQCTQIPKSKYIRTLIWNDCQLLLFKDESVQVNTSIQNMIDIQLTEHSMFILLENGEIYKLNLSGLKKEKYLRETATTNDDVNQRIFSDLLNGDTQQYKPANFELTKDNLLCKVPNASSLRIVNSVLLVLCQDRDAYSLSFFNVDWLQDNKNVETDIERFELISNKFQHKDSTCNALSGQIKGIQQTVPIAIKEKLFICYKESHFKEITNPSFVEKSCILQNNLFNQLFGTKIALLECPVILVSLPNGLVLFIPLVSSACGGPQNSVLYDLEQPIIDIHGLKLERGNMYENLNDASQSVDEKTSNCLILVGLHGKVLFLFLESKSGLVSRCEGLLPSPVYSSSVVNHVIFHSTLLEMYSSQCWLNEMNSLQRLSSEPVGFHNAICVYGNKVKKQEPQQPLNTIDVIAVTHFGIIYKLNLHLNEQIQQSFTTKSGGKQIGDLLTSIGSLSVKLDEVNKEVTQHDNTIAQLSLASYLASIYCSESKSINDPPININSYVEQRNAGLRQTYKLVVSFSSKGITFTEDWSASIVLLSQKISSSNSKDFNLTKFVKLVCLFDGHHQDVLIDLPGDHLSEVLPFNVNISLVLLSNSSAFTAAAETVPKVNQETMDHITIPCFSNTIDVIHVLTPNIVSTPVNKTIDESCDKSTSVKSAIDCITRQMPCSEFYSDSTMTSLRGPFKSDPVTCTMLVPPQLVQYFIYNMAKKGEKPHEKLFEMIFADNMYVNAACKGQVHAKIMMPSGNQVLLNLMTTSDTTHWEVNIQTCDISDMCALRFAINHRLQKFMKFHVKTEAFRHSHSTQDLQRYLRQLQAMQEEVDSLKDQNKQSSNEEKFKKVLHIYQKLRNTTI